ncbi:MAG: Conserved putative rane protein [Amycolatopsis sp.]|uniref:sensor histidine kinase n=1 Tax=Amycolatopsis sp. TaxID=37632 RepID=UPI002634540E|nr:histidine kinase [Amycolatopsis sp.]MCU1687317.1 Conserved putative rane protein [Amycolatopsis sp.]
MRDISGSLARQSMLVAGVCLVADVGLFLTGGPSLTSGWQVWLVLVGSVVVDAALAGPARSSGWVAAGHAVMLVVSASLLPRSPVGNNAGILVAGYRAGAWLETIPALAALVTLVAGLATSHLLSIGRSSHDWRFITVNLLASGLMPWLVGRYTTARRAYLAELQQRAERQRHDEQEAIRRAITEDRIAIARDLHDVISHHVSAIGIHAGAARLGLPGDDVPAKRSLSAVESSSRSAMVDLRRLLDLLHGQDSGTAERQPGLDNLDELLDGVRAAGLPATVSTLGEARSLPSSLDVALYRIAQEALTNALRHGGGGAVELELDFRPPNVTLSVTNDFSPSAPEVATDFRHRGLAGIRQRVTLFGGQVTYGPLSGSTRWQVRADFPLEEESTP